MLIFVVADSLITVFEFCDYANFFYRFVIAVRKLKFYYFNASICLLWFANVFSSTLIEVHLVFSASSNFDFSYSYDFFNDLYSALSDSCISLYIICFSTRLELNL